MDHRNATVSETSFAPIIQGPHYAVIFTSLRRSDDGEAYGTMADLMLEMAQQQDGYLGVESVRDASGMGITVSYWRDLDAIRGWREVAEHRAAQEQGRREWYEHYSVRICRVERSYSLLPDTTPRASSR